MVASLKTGITTERKKVISGKHYKPKSPHLQRNFHWVLFSIIFLWGAYLRIPAFFLPSNVGDAPSYQATAMKMNYGFMRHYNVFNYRMAPVDSPGLIDYVWEDNPQKWTAMRTREVNRRPLNMQPPLLSVLTWISHGIFKHGSPYTSVSENRHDSIFTNPPWEFFKAQFYAIVVPFTFSLLILPLIYLFCLKYWDWKVGLIAVLLMATSSIDIAIAPKLFADGLLTFFTFLSLFLFLKSLEPKTEHPYYIAGFAGTALALSFFAKLTGIIFSLSFVMASLLAPRESLTFKQKIFDPRLWIAGTTVILLTLPWHILVFQTYGTILPNTPQDPDNPWFKYVFNVSPFSYLWGLLDFLPPVIIGGIYGLFCLTKPRRFYIETTLFVTSLVYLGVFLLFIKTETAGVEHRYLMPIHPLLIILTSVAIMKLIQLIKIDWLKSMAIALAFVLILLSGWRSAKIGLKYSFASLANFAPTEHF